MITYGEVKTSPHGWMEAMPNANEPTPKFELALAELIDGYRGKVSREEALDALKAQTERVDQDWEVAGPSPKGDDDGPEAA